MSVDVDAVNERLNGLVTLLQAVGVDGDIGGSGKSGKKGGMPDARQLDDSQIEAIIRKLQQAQEEAPQIIAALEAHAEARSLNGGSTHKRSQQQQPPPEPVHAAPPEPEIDEDESEEDEDEGNYPMVGPGVSDDISVVSDLTTPTVLADVSVPDEEHYRDTLPPMIVGGGPGNAPPMLINPTKRKNLVSQVRPGGIAPPRRNVPAPNRGGAAATRRKNYNHVVSRLAHEAPVEKPQGAPRSVGSSKSSRSSRSTDGTKKIKKKKAPRPAAPPAAQVAPAAPTNSGWNAFESNPPPKKETRKSATVIDNDGFLIGDSFDPFQESAATASPAGDLAAFAPPPPQQPQQPRRPRPSKQKQQPDPRAAATNFSQPLRKPKEGAASAGRRKARRASLV